MNNNAEQHDDQAFIKRIQAARPNPIPSVEFQRKLLNRMLAKAQKTSVAALHTVKLPKRRWLLRMSPAVAAILMIVVLWWLIGGDVKTASAGFAEMLKRVREAQTVSFDSTYRLPSQPDVTVHVSMARPGRMRVAWPDGRIHIVNSAKGKYLGLTPSTMEARLRVLNRPRMYTEPLDILQRSDASTSTFVHTEAQNGRTIDVYKMPIEQGSLLVWVDRSQEMPIRIESRSISEDGLETVWVLDNFQWNAAISSSQFSLEVPQGYNLVVNEDVSSEESLVRMLRICADMSGGPFPEKVDGITVYNIFMTAKHNGGIYKHKVSPDKTATSMDEETKQMYRTCLLGLAYVKKLTEQGKWHYSGSGVKLGDQAVVCWWQLPQSQTYRAVFGDLTVRDIQPNELADYGIHLSDTESE